MILKKKEKERTDLGEQTTMDRLRSAQRRNIGILNFMKEEWELRKIKRDEKYGK